MAVFGALSAILTADTKGWKSGMKEARDETDKTKKKFFDLKQLSENFGKRSALGQTLKLAAGGGAIGALSAAGREMKEFTGKILEMKAQLKSGDISMGEFADKTAESLPVLGAFYSAGKNITEMFTGQAAAAAKAEASMNAVIAVNQKGQKQVEDLQKETKSFAESQAAQRKQLEQSIALSGITDETEKQIQSAKFEMQNQLDKLQDEAKKLTDRSAIDAANKELDKLGQGPANAENKARIATLAVFIAQEKKTILNATQEVEKSKADIIANSEASISKAKAERAEQDAKKQEEVDAKAAQDEKRKEIQTLEDKKKSIEETLHKSKVNDVARSAESEALRGGGIVQLSPKITNPMQKTAEESLVQLKYIDDHIQALKGDAGGDGQDVYVSF